MLALVIFMFALSYATQIAAVRSCEGRVIDPEKMTKKTMTLLKLCMLTP